jgi:DNA (cytosine-5)-methyltransferase 1
MNLNVIDLFCGCGGLSYGFIQAGFNVILGIDNDKAALETFERNHGNSKAINIDLSSEDACQKIKEVIDNKSVDVIIGGRLVKDFH